MSVAVAKPFAARPRNQSPSASRPPRGAPSTPRNTVAGIIHLPSPKSASPSRSSAPSLSSRHSAPTASAVTLDSPDASASLEGASSPRPRRTRQKKSKLSTPPEGIIISGTDTDEPTATPSSKPRRNPSSSAAVGVVASPLSQPAPSTPTAKSTPLAKRRPRSKQSRQRSPPNTAEDGDETEETVDAVVPLTRPRPVPLPLPIPSSATPVTPDPWADNPAMALLSKSAPALGLAFPQHVQRPPSTPGSKLSGRSEKAYNAASSSADESSWDMPTTSAKTSNSNLTWQQASFSSSSPRSTPTKADSRRPQSARQPGQQQFAKQQLQPPRSGATVSALSESAPPTSNDGLTWQQRQLLGPRAGHGHSNSFSGVTTDLRSALEASPSPSTSTSVSTPQRSRRNQLRDAETFGLDSPISEDNVFSSIPSFPASPSTASSASPGKKQQQRKSPAKASVSAPVLPAEARYAGPTFHNSPAPEMLPLPSFMLRRKLRGMGFSL